MKKILIIMMLTAILLISGCIAVYAQEFDDISNDSVCAEAVNLLSGYNVIDGYPNNTFNPDGFVTRAEMAKIITIMAGYSEYTQNMTSSYTDMSGHWAEKYVELANSLNLVRENTDKTFGPDVNITYPEAVAMIIRLLGYDDQVLGGKYPSNYYKKASDLNLFNNVVMKYEYVTRRDIAVILYNALDCKLVKFKSNNEIVDTGKNLISLIGYVSNETITINHLNYDDGFDYTDYVFNKWDVYYNKNDQVVYMKNPKLNEFKGKVTGILSNKVIFVTNKVGNIKIFKMDDIPIIFNGAEGNFQSLEDSEINVVYEESNSGEKIKGVIASKVTDVKFIANKDRYIWGNNTFAGKYLPIVSSNDKTVNFNKIKVYGAVNNIQDIEMNDVVYFYETDESNTSKTRLNMEVVRSSVKGVVTSVEASNNKVTYKINNKSYTTGTNYIYTENASVYDTVNIILDKEGCIVKLYITNYGKSPTTYGVVLHTANGTNKLATIRVLDQTGKTQAYALAENASVITEVYSGMNTQYTSLLSKNDIVKFDPVTVGSVKIIDKKQAKLVASYYDENTKTIKNGNLKLHAQTFVVYENNGVYEKININNIGSYIEGKVVLGANGYVDVLYLSKGIKVKENVKEEIPKTVEKENTIKAYSGNIYSIISSIKKVNGTTSEVSFFNSSRTYTVSSDVVQNISFYKNSYVKAVINNNKIAAIYKISPETYKAKVTAVYSNQIQIDGVTYIEYAPNVAVYKCSVDSSGNISNFKPSSKSAVKSGSVVQLYDTDGQFDGVIDVIFIFE